MKAPVSLTQSIKSISEAINENEVPGIPVSLQTIFDLYGILRASPNTGAVTKSEAKHYVLEAITTAAMLQDQVTVETMLTKTSITEEEFNAFNMASTLK